jgi:hypothetical protein
MIISMKCENLGKRQRAYDASLAVHSYGEIRIFFRLRGFQLLHGRLGLFDPLDPPV